MHGVGGHLCCYSFYCDGGTSFLVGFCAGEQKIGENGYIAIIC